MSHDKAEVVRECEPLMNRLYGLADLVRSLVISALVGTILVIINQGPDFLLTPMFDAGSTVKVALNYLIPFCVASASAILANHSRASP